MMLGHPFRVCISESLNEKKSYLAGKKRCQLRITMTEKDPESKALRDVGLLLPIK